MVVVEGGGEVIHALVATRAVVITGIEVRDSGRFQVGVAELDNERTAVIAEVDAVEEKRRVLTETDVGLEVAQRASPRVAEPELGLGQEHGLTGEGVEPSALIVQLVAIDGELQFQAPAVVVYLHVHLWVHVIGTLAQVDGEVVLPVVGAALVGVGVVGDGFEGIELGRKHKGVGMIQIIACVVMAVVEHIGETQVDVFCNLVAVAKVHYAPCVAIEEGRGI